MTERTMTIQGLRELADFLDAHPSIPLSGHRINEFIDTRDEWNDIHAAAPAMTTIKTADFLTLRQSFAGGVVLDLNVERPPQDDDSVPDDTTPRPFGFV
jgi:hypothetical protein